MSGWWDLAACAEVDLEIFFPAQGGFSQNSPAARICAVCEVRAECLAEGLRDDERANQFGGHGIWGGMTAPQRERLRGKRR